ncbi:hypothetical protein [Crocosphaera sp.]|uniref:hypothetical protein n=1 Tax=Crocosphaera sp. TaxID=2729996 RepID=UPI003F268595|nr:hypothetical protein [Crocosphaera sp.]
MKKAISGIAISLYLLLFTATGIITLLGIIDKISIKDEYLDKLFVLLICEVSVGVTTLFKTSVIDLFKNDTDIISGYWWEIIKYQQEDAISFVEIKYLLNKNKLDLRGDTYNEKGYRYSKWSAISASLDPRDCEIYYWWKGDKEKEKSDYRGIGYFHFHKVPNTNKLNKGDGWFISDEVNTFQALKAKTIQKVDLHRASAEDIKIMQLEDHETKKKNLISVTYSKLGGVV